MTNKVLLPTISADGMISTLNNMGAMMTTICPYGQRWVDYAAGRKGWVLDVGCAYGATTIAAIARKAKVIACDCFQGHLDNVKLQVPAKSRRSLRTILANFPDIDLEDGSVEAIFSGRVFHFMDDKTVERAAQEMFRLLKSDCPAIVTVDSPYLKTLTSFIPVYEARKAAGEKFPGLVEDMSLYEPDEVAAGYIPKMMHFLDPNVLTRVFKAAGFHCVTAEFFDRGSGYPSFLRRPEGKEGVALVAWK
ncbi:MAG: class I SAM-dependent methyltransferase [Candidatus Obscuribacterales bacterium]|nr:class I SAM-dependent methyltransferase [Candidatus Obscuribacterales bacterium]